MKNNFLSLFCFAFFVITGKAQPLIIDAREGKSTSREVTCGEAQSLIIQVSDSWKYFSHVRITIKGNSNLALSGYTYRDSEIKIPGEAHLDVRVNKYSILEIAWKGGLLFTLLTLFTGIPFYIMEFRKGDPRIQMPWTFSDYSRLQFMVMLMVAGGVFVAIIPFGDNGIPVGDALMRLVGIGELVFLVIPHIVTYFVTKTIHKFRKGYKNKLVAVRH